MYKCRHIKVNKKFIFRFILIVGLLMIPLPLIQVYMSDKEIESNMQKVEQQSQQIEEKPIEVIKPKIGEIVGTISMDRLDKTIPLIYGSNEETLKGGACIYENMPLFSEGTPLIMGHRDTVFSFLQDIKEGDVFKIKYLNETLKYKVSEIKIVPKEDEAYITKDLGKDKLKLDTCYPFYFLGHAPKRFVVTLDKI